MLVNNANSEQGDNDPARARAGRHDSSQIGSLLARAKTGSTSALGRMLDLCRPQLLRTARKEVANRLRFETSGSDVVQDALVNAAKGFGRFRGQHATEFIGWLRAILTHRLAEIARRTDRRNNCRTGELVNGAVEGLSQFVIDKQESPSTIVGNQEYSELIRAALVRMSRRDQEVLRLRFEDQLTFPQIGKGLGLSEDAARMLFRRAVRRLQRELPDLTSELI